MKLLPLQDTFSKVKAVEELVQQILRFPDEAASLIASELTQQREIRKRQVQESKDSEQGNLKTEKESKETSSRFRGRKQVPEATPWDQEDRQCCIDFRA